MVFDGYYMNSNRIIALEFLKYTFMKYFEIFPPEILLKIYTMTCNLFWENTYGFWQIFLKEKYFDYLIFLKKEKKCFIGNKYEA